MRPGGFPGTRRPDAWAVERTGPAPAISVSSRSGLASGAGDKPAPSCAPHFAGDANQHEGGSFYPMCLPAFDRNGLSCSMGRRRIAPPLLQWRADDEERLVSVASTVHLNILLYKPVLFDVTGSKFDDEFSKFDLILRRDDALAVHQQD